MNRIEPPDEWIRQRILENWDKVAKPIDGMGRFEKLTAQIGAIQGTERVEISKKAVIIMCADNGIVEEGISQSGQEVTRIVAENMGRGQSSVCRMAKLIGADTIPIDIGINCSSEIEGVWNRKVRMGTRNFKLEPAMTEAEVIQAIETGIEVVCDCRKRGHKILGIGEMGIGNTTTSSALAAVLLNCEVSEVTGRGAGLSDKKLLHKQKIISDAIERYGLRSTKEMKALQTLGGLDIAGLAGVCIGGAIYHIPIVLDGVISMVAALVAEKLVPGTKEFLLPSHNGKEPAVKRLAEVLELEPVIEAEMALGEGTGAVMMFSLLEMVLAVYRESATFQEIQIEQYKRYEQI